MVDGMSSLVRSHLEQRHELETPEHFRQCVQDFFADQRRRPHEQSRAVHLLTQYRDWPFDYFVEYLELM